MKIIYVRETKDTCDIIQRVLLKIKSFFNIIKIENNGEKSIYHLPIFKNGRISEHRIEKLSKKISSLLEKDGSNTIVLSQYLYSNQLLKNCLYSDNIDVLNGRYLFKCLIYKIIEYIFQIKGKELEFRGSFIFN